MDQKGEIVFGIDDSIINDIDSFKKDISYLKGEIENFKKMMNPNNINILSERIYLMEQENRDLKNLLESMGPMNYIDKLYREISELKQRVIPKYGLGTKGENK